MASVVLSLPRTTLTMDEGRIVKWIKRDGDMVAKGEPVAEMETDKAIVEVQAPITGYLRTILLGEDTGAAIGAPLAIFTDTDDEPVDGAEGEPHLESRAADGMSAPGDQQPSQVSAAPAPPRSALVDGLVRASPAVRMRARAEGVSLSQIHGTGPRGRILLRDFEEFLALGGAAGRVSLEQQSQAQPLAEQVGKRLDPSRMRQSIGAAMLRSWREQPQFNVTRHLDMTHVQSVRQMLAQSFEASTGVRLSITDFLIQAFARALSGHPTLNVITAPDGEAYAAQRVDMGIAVAVADGLVVPVLRGADVLTLPQIAVQRSELTRRALDNRLGAKDLGGGTFTLSNLGPFGIDEFEAIINPGEAAIAAVGRVRETPVAHEGQVVIRPLLTMTLSVDHRRADGATAARFMADVADRVEGRTGWIFF